MHTYQKHNLKLPHRRCESSQVALRGKGSHKWKDAWLAGFCFVGVKRPLSHYSSLFRHLFIVCAAGAHVRAALRRLLCKLKGPASAALTLAWAARTWWKWVLFISNHDFARHVHHFARRAHTAPFRFSNDAAQIKANTCDECTTHITMGVRVTVTMEALIISKYMRCSCFNHYSTAFEIIFCWKFNQNCWKVCCVYS